MNKEKTKVIWIGKIRLSREKLNVSVKLDWGSTEFTLLGLDFSTDLIKMEEINYTKIYEKMNGEINKWKNRKLTPFGKISIIKSNILSKGIHVMTSLPTPETFLSKGNSLLYSFLCQLTCQSADIMSSLCGVGVRVCVRVRVNIFSSKTTRPRDMLFFLKDTLSIEAEKLFKACKSVCSSVC